MTGTMITVVMVTSSSMHHSQSTLVHSHPTGHVARHAPQDVHVTSHRYFSFQVIHKMSTALQIEVTLKVHGEGYASCGSVASPLLYRCFCRCFTAALPLLCCYFTVALRYRCFAVISPLLCRYFPLQVHGEWIRHLWFLRGAEPGCLVQARHEIDYDCDCDYD